MRKGSDIAWNDLVRACMAICIQYVCLTACMHVHASASATCAVCTCLLLCTLSDYCSPQCERECNNGSSREDCVPCAGGRGCLFPPLKRKLLSALRRNKSFIWFVVFLTKGSWSRNKALLSVRSAPILSLLLSAPQHTLTDTVMQVETWSHFYWQVAVFLQRQTNIIPTSPTNMNISRSYICCAIFCTHIN